MLNDLQLSSLALFVAAVLCAWAGHFHIMSAERSSDASQGIPAVNDPAALDQKQYANLAEGASLGAGGGAAFGGAVGAAGGPAGAVLGAAVGGLAGAAAGGVVAEQRGPEGDAVNMKGVATHLSGGPDASMGSDLDSHAPSVAAATNKSAMS